MEHRWQQIVATLKTEIEDRVRLPGDRLPSEFELAARFGVHRNTIRYAVADLAKQGYVSVERGRGTFVTSHMLEYALGRRSRFQSNLSGKGREGTRRILRISDEKADRGVAQCLGLRTATKVVRVDTLSEADGVPISAAQIYLPAARFAKWPKAFSESQDEVAAFRACGVEDYVRRSFTFFATTPTEAEAHTLSQTINRPIIRFELVNVDQDGTPIQLSRSITAGDRVEFAVTFDGDGHPQ